MIRLLPSRISLTDNEVNEYITRSDFQLIAQLMCLPAVAGAMGLYNPSTLPKIQRGAQRSRDEALVHCSTPYIPSSASSEVDGPSDHISSFYAGDQQQQKPTSSDNYQSDQSQERNRFRRDSVLSQEDGIAPIGQESHRMRKHYETTEAPIRGSERQARRRKHSSSLSLQSSRTSPTNSFVDSDPSSAVTRLDRFPNTNPTQPSCGLTRRPACQRRFRPRSFSDPCDTPLPSIQHRRARRSLGTPMIPEVSTPISSSDQTRLIPELCKLDAHSIQEDDLPTIFPEYAGSMPPSLVPESCSDVSREAFERHLSLPPHPTSRLANTSDGMSSSPSLDSNHQSALKLMRERSATLGAQQDRASPLDALSEDVRGCSGESWMVDLPTRTRRKTNEKDLRMPCTDGSETPVSNETSRTPQSNDSAISRSQRRRPVLSLSIPSLSSPVPRQVQRSDMERIQQPARRPVSGNLGRSMPTEFAVTGGGRPSFGWLGQGYSQQTIRRRPLPSAEQENEDDLEQYEDERQSRQERIQATSGGVLSRTPPRQGRLEQYL